ncbi:ATP synthase complex subunit H-domain-containing protein [Umbelopsis sp. AD052]|nr:ATP synthase complex subunit H-domain-containing protein [Umbelopsis sp. AD052]
MSFVRVATRSLVAAPFKAAMRPAVPVMAVRTFIIPSMPVQKDVIQDLYLKELKNYKPAPVAKGSEEGQVKDLKLPAAPVAPAVEDLTEALANYDKEIEEPVAEEAEEAAH